MTRAELLAYKGQTVNSGIGSKGEMVAGHTVKRQTVRYPCHVPHKQSSSVDRNSGKAVQ